MSKLLTLSNPTKKKKKKNSCWLFVCMISYHKLRATAQVRCGNEDLCLLGSLDI